MLGASSGGFDIKDDHNFEVVDLDLSFCLALDQPLTTMDKEAFKAPSEIQTRCNQSIHTISIFSYLLPPTSYLTPLPSLHPIGTNAAATLCVPLSVASKLNCAAAFLVSCISTLIPRLLMYCLV